MWEVVITYDIMHNMIVLEEQDDIIYDAGWEFEGGLVEP
jgi:hypothetical protein